MKKTLKEYLRPIPVRSLRQFQERDPEAFSVYRDVQLGLKDVADGALELQNLGYDNNILFTSARDDQDYEELSDDSSEQNDVLTNIPVLRKEDMKDFISQNMLEDAERLLNSHLSVTAVLTLLKEKYRKDFSFLAGYLYQKENFKENTKRQREIDYWTTLSRMINEGDYRFKKVLEFFPEKLENRVKKDFELVESFLNKGRIYE